MGDLADVGAYPVVERRHLLRQAQEVENEASSKYEGSMTDTRRPASAIKLSWGSSISTSGSRDYAVRLKLGNQKRWIAGVVLGIHVKEHLKSIQIRRKLPSYSVEL